ncbi:Stromal membrane-associated protein [Trichinella spiralis]|uniref:Stromal membrane-associated protein n=1 Tax=Trichinella spiralis TaxID=6334 RepID=A0ABR3KGJ1_TRISP
MAALHLSASFQPPILLLLFWAVFCATSFLVAVEPCQVLPGIIDAYAAVLNFMLDVSLFIERMIRWCNLQKRQMLKSSIFCLVVAAVPGSTPSAYEVKKLSRVTLSPFSPFTMSRTTRIPWYFARVPLDGLPVYICIFHA